MTGILDMKITAFNCTFLKFKIPVSISIYNALQVILKIDFVLLYISIYLILFYIKGVD